MKENISNLIYIFLSLFPIALIIFLTNLFFKKRNASIKLLEDSELLIISRNIFQDIIMKNEHLLEKISSIIAKREMENQNIILNNENKNDIQKIKKIHEIKKRSLMSKIKKFFEN